jgi:predicted ATP-grasp superfamily ATP-dependent carboligase
MALAVARSLGEAGVPIVMVHYDAEDMAHASRYVLEEIRTPDPRGDDVHLIDALLALGARWPNAVLIPTSDESVVAIARHKTLLTGSLVVACPGAEVTERFIEKSRTYALAEANGVAVPRSFAPASVMDLDDGVQMLGFPMLVKPIESHRYFHRFGRKMVRVGTREALEAAYREAAGAGLDVMLQEIIPGPDSAVANYNAYVTEGRPVVEFTARQLRKVPPAFGSPRVVISEHIPSVIEPGRRTLEAIGFEGFACTEFKLDRRDQTWKLMEVNGRHNLSGILATRCGINFPLLQYRHLVAGELPRQTSFRAGVYWTDVFRDVVYSALYVRQERPSPVDWLRPYARRHCDAIVDGKDMGPFWARLGHLMSHVGESARLARGR